MRLEGDGIRWGPAHVDLLLALQNASCCKCRAETWARIAGGWRDPPLAICGRPLRPAADETQHSVGVETMVSTNITGWDRITSDPEVMGGKPCIRGLRVTVGAIVSLVAAGQTTAAILAAYPYLEPNDIREALTFAAWRVKERDLPLTGV